MKTHLYNTLMAIIILLKLCLLTIAILSLISHSFEWDSKKVEFIDTFREEALTVSEVFMYLVLVVVFFPTRQVHDIKIGKEEQAIAFVLGLLGIFHTQWHTFNGFFLDINKLISN